MAPRFPRSRVSVLENPYLREFELLYPKAVAELDYWNRLAWGVRELGSPEAFVARFFEPQNRLRRQYAWAIPTEPAIRAIAAFSPLVEIGAGTGYWTWLLRQAGADVIPYDAIPWRADRLQERHNAFHGPNRSFVHVEEGGPEKAASHADRCLFLCWPPRDDMAERCLEYYAGSSVIHVGAPGLTGSARFYEMLNAVGVLEKVIELPQWWNEKVDKVEFWRRR